MKTLNTSELSGIALDWAVAQAEGNVRLRYDSREGLVINNILGWIAYRPSVAWEQGGPIIEKEKISVGFERYGSPSGAQWDAVKVHKEAHVLEYGPTPLIAAMRCYVAAKLGEHVDVPDELVL
jgi:hypothetical protein